MMAAPTIPLNKFTSEPGLVDLFNLFKRTCKIETNCHGIGTIQSFDSVHQTAQVTMNYTRTIFSFSNNQYTTTTPSYPILLDVPLIVISGGSGALTMPIAKGDNCIVMFNDVALDNWLNSGQVGPVSSPRRHSFSDAIALVGLRPTSSPLSNYDASRVKLALGTTFIGLDSSLIEINNAAGKSLGYILDQMMTKLNTIATTLQGNPGVETAASAAGVQLASMVATLQPLVEGLLK